MNPASWLLCTIGLLEAGTSTGQKHPFGMLERLGLTVDHHDVALTQTSIARRLAAENAVTTNARDGDLGTARTHVAHRAAHGPGARGNDDGFQLLAILVRLVEVARIGAAMDI